MELGNPYTNAKQFWVDIKKEFQLDTERANSSNNFGSKPFVTLTFAQSLDAKISSSNKRQILLSGRESMILTHRLRTVHDAILVGVGTVLTDNPRLNVRFVEPSEAESASNPVPVVLDTNLRIPEDARIIHYYKEDARCKPPIIVCGYKSGSSQKKQLLESFGAKVLVVPENSCDVSGRPTVSGVLAALGRERIRSLMVEGGSQIIGSFLKAHVADANSVVDLLLVTVSPKIIGSLGAGPTDSIALDGTPPAVDLKAQLYRQFGSDIVVAALL